MSLSKLKQQKGLAGISALQEQLEKIKGKSGEDNKFQDDRFWSLKRDKTDVGAAVIRFLPAPEGENLPFVRLFEHHFKGPGGYYIERSLTTLSLPDPVSELNARLWKGSDADKEVARKQKRKLSYIANILVVKDPAAPENEGKVFLFKFGKKIFDKLEQVMYPQSDGIDEIEPINPFCPWTGANFKLKASKVDGYISYADSSFSKPSALFGGDDDQIDALWKTEYSLKELVAPETFKSYDELKARLDKVLGLSGGMPVGSSVPPIASSNVRQVASSIEDEEDMESFPDTDLDEDDDLSYLKKLAKS
jgi:hypothetical protein